MRIRPARPGDAAAQSDLYRRSVAALGARDYSRAQVAAWASRAPSPAGFRTLGSDGRKTFVAETDAAMLGFADLEPDGHIDFFYCAPEAAGTGVAAELYACLEAEARARALPLLFAEASETARRFFVRQGFLVIARRDFEIGGVGLHNYAVEKRLDQG